MPQLVRGVVVAMLLKSAIGRRGAGVQRLRIQRSSSDSGIGGSAAQLRHVDATENQP
jgi:hypothetical protein